MTAEVEELRKLICSRPIRYKSELELQNLISERLQSFGPDELLREFNLSRRDRPDFFLVTPGLAIEVKIKGSPADLFHQVERYAQDDRVKGVLIVRHRNPQLPTEIHGKPLFCLELYPHLI